MRRAIETGNVSKACREFGISRPQFYTYLKRFNEEGIEGLQNRPTIAKNHPFATPFIIAEQIKAVAMDHPGRGPVYYRAWLLDSGIKTSVITIRKILKQFNILTQHDRWIALEEQYRINQINISVNQRKFLYRFNPHFLEINNKTNRPGDRLIFKPDLYSEGLFLQNNIMLEVYIDTFSSYVFGHIRQADATTKSVTFLRKIIIPKAISLQDSNKRLTISSQHAIPNIAEIATCNDFIVNYIDPSSHEENGFVIRFRDCFVKQFIEKNVHGKNIFYPPLYRLSEKFKYWLHQYNKSPLEGYPNYGESPNSRFHGSV